MKFDLMPYENRMKKTVEVLESEFAAIRVGRASPKVLDKVTVPYYGVQTPIEGVATVKVADARTLLIQPWDASLLKDLEKAIAASDIGIMPQNDGKMLRMNFPPLTEERRKEHTKKTAKMGEEAKVAIRNLRRDANEDVKKQKKDSILTEDDQKDAEKDIQNLTDRYIKIIDEVVAKKDKEIMEF